MWAQALNHPAALPTPTTYPSDHAARPQMKPTPEELAPIGQEVVTLLQTGGAADFAKHFAVRTDDYLYFYDTNLPPDLIVKLKADQSTEGKQIEQLTKTAALFLDWADKLHWDFGHAPVQVEVAAPTNTGWQILDRPTRLGLEVPVVWQLNLFLTRSTNYPDGDVSRWGWAIWPNFPTAGD